MKKLAPDIETACLTIETENNDTVQRRCRQAIALARGTRSCAISAARCRGSSKPPAADVVDVLAQSHPEEIAEAQGLGLKVLPWTVNDPADMARLIDWRVDGIITDYPDRRARSWRRRDCRLP